MSLDSPYGKGSKSTDTIITEMERANPMLKLLRNEEVTLPYPHLDITFKPNEYDIMADQLPEWEIYKTPKERVKILLDTFDNKNFNVLLANYLWIWAMDHNETQAIYLSHIHELPDFGEIYKWFCYWKEKK